MNHQGLNVSILERLRAFDTPTISNTIELFHCVPRNAGYMDHRIQSCFPDMPPMVGFAVTATFRSDQPPRGSDVYSALETQLEAFASLPGPAVVVFQDLDDPPVSATFGEVMCSTYQAFGAAGIITSGAGRDLEQVRALGFPAFTGSTICSHAYCHILQVQVPIRVGGLTIAPGDLLHGDANGVTRIPLEILNELPDAAQAFVEAEKEVLDYVKSPPNGKATVEGFREAKARMARRVAELESKYRRTP